MSSLVKKVMLESGTEVSQVNYNGTTVFQKDNNMTTSCTLGSTSKTNNYYFYNHNDYTYIKPQTVSLQTSSGIMIDSISAKFNLDSAKGYNDIIDSTSYNMSGGFSAMLNSCKVYIFKHYKYDFYIGLYQSGSTLYVYDLTPISYPDDSSNNNAGSENNSYPTFVTTSSDRNLIDYSSFNIHYIDLTINYSINNKVEYVNYSNTNKVYYGSNLIYNKYTPISFSYTKKTIEASDSGSSDETVYPVTAKFDDSVSFSEKIDLYYFQSLGNNMYNFETFYLSAGNYGTQSLSLFTNSYSLGSSDWISPSTSYYYTYKVSDKKFNIIYSKMLAS